MNNEDLLISLTPKGYLFNKLEKYGVTLEDFDEIWDGLADFIDEHNMQNNEGGIPALLFNSDGGTCLSVTFDDE